LYHPLDILQLQSLLNADAIRMVAFEIVRSLKSRLESRKISSDEFNTFSAVECVIIERNYSAKELMEHKTKIYEVSTGIYAGPSSRARSRA